MAALGWLLNLDFAGGGVAITYTSEGEIRLYTAANWTGVSFALETNIRAISGTAYARMWDKTSAAAVSGSDLSTTATVKTRLRSGALTLTDTHEYESQFAHSVGGSGETWGARPIALP